MSRDTFLESGKNTPDSKNSSRTSKFYFKPFRLKDITQDILDAENEPLKELPLNEIESEESSECFQEVKKETHIIVDEKFDDLGVKVLQTPRKRSENTTRVQNEIVTLFSSTPRYPLSCKEFLTPGFKETVAKINVNNILKVPVLTPKLAQPVPIYNNVDEKLTNKLKHLNSNNYKQPHDNKENVNKNHQIDMKEILVNNVNYLILNQLGRGGSSVVYHCYNLHTKEERAIKKVNLESDTHRIGYMNEVNVLAQLRNSDRIIHMYDFECIESEKTVLLVLEKGESDLSKILRDAGKSKEHLPLYVIIYYWMEMLYAVQQIHSNGIIHADLKPANFLLINGRLKLIDFGISTCVQDDMTSAIRTCQVGSLQYISPEALINQPSKNAASPNFGKPKYKLKYKTDVWSLGCIFYQLVYQRTPFQHVEHLWAKLALIMNPDHEIKYPTLDWVPEKFIGTIKSCLQYNIMDRPSIIDLIKDYENVNLAK
ncbi:hypothetical protein RI129_008655 [Pyrocoelia pectoralis]|uniref:Protein kinase domain-containing protein n=1 Tax=Pyrocoelia pectoralis TaxID=417401 RepID=A0AAN7ZKC0_9COLE